MTLEHQISIGYQNWIVILTKKKLPALKIKSKYLKSKHKNAKLLRMGKKTTKRTKKSSLNFIERLGRRTKISILYPYPNLHLNMLLLFKVIMYNI